MRAVNPTQTWDHIFAEDLALPESERTVFHLKTLDVNEETFLQDHLGSMTDEGWSIKIGTQELIGLHIGLAGVDNLLDKDGEAVKFERDETKAYVIAKVRPWKSSCLSAIPKEARRELAKLIMAGPKLKEAEAKN